jgi:anti-sigma B factor antagonist
MEHVSESGNAQGGIERLADEDGAPLVRIFGEIDLSNADRVRVALDPIIEEHPERLIVDLRDLTFLDSSGLTVFVRAASRVGSLELRNVSVIVHRIIDATGLSDILHIEQ